MSREPPVSRELYPEDELLERLRAAARDRGEPPSAGWWAQRGLRPTTRVFSQRFGSWNHALELAGLPTREPKQDYSWAPSDGELLEGVRLVAAALGHRPTGGDYGAYVRSHPELGLRGLGTVTGRLGRWSEIVALVDAPDKRPPAPSDERLLDLLRAAAAELGRPPSARWWQRHRPPGALSVEAMARRFGSWNAALAAAGLVTLGG